MTGGNKVLAKENVKDWGDDRKGKGGSSGMRVAGQWVAGATGTLGSGWNTGGRGGLWV